MDDEISLAGMHVLVLEDDMLVAMLVEDTLQDHECVILGPVESLEEGLEIARNRKVDAAVMDVNIGGEKVYEIAEILEARGVPFILISGYGPGAVPEAHPNWQICSKPFRAEEMMELLFAEIAKSRG
jgi:DNA-binding NtrC family response regulator